MLLKKQISLFLLLSFISLSATAELKVNPLFGNHMVIQRDQPIKVWGRSTPGSRVDVSLNGERGQCQSEISGKWELLLREMPVGGPYCLVVECGSENSVFEDIFIGDVWLASGQSNMDYKMSQGVKNGVEELANADYPQIRFIKDAVRASAKPEEEIPQAEWKVCTPETVGDFSAVAYFFAREVFKETGVPVGIINASWGGSPIEAWMSPETLERLPHVKGPVIPEVEDGTCELVNYSSINEANAGECLKLVNSSFLGLEKGVYLPDYDDSGWQHRDALPNWQELTNQIYWFRKTFDLVSLPEKGLAFDLGYYQGLFAAYVNGKEVLRGENLPAVFSVSKSDLKEGENVIAFRLANPWFPPFIEPGESGAFASDSQNGMRIDLLHDWVCSGSEEAPLPKFYSIQQIASGCWLGMVHPLLKTKIKGVIWYQGEQNGDAGFQYRELFSGMISDWRIRFEQGYFPFIWVQLANFGQESVVENNGWPFVREAQDMALKLPYTAMATAIDVGEINDIHPKDKATVGKRLALCALNTAYGMDVESSGPRFESMVIQDKAVIVSFTHAAGLHTRGEASPKGFTIAGEDMIFHPAMARIAGEAIVLTSDEVMQPIAVRYAWAKNPPTNLYNKANLPAFPFRTDDWPEDVRP